MYAALTRSRSSCASCRSITSGGKPCSFRTVDAMARNPCDVISKPRLRSATRTGDFADELEEIETLISSNKQREKSKTQIFREGEELQRIEKERADRRMKLGKKTDPTQNLGEGGETDEHVAKALGMSTEQWRKLKSIFAKAQHGDENAQEMVKALDAGTISVHKAYQEVRKRLNGEGVQSSLPPLHGALEGPTAYIFPQEVV